MGELKSPGIPKKFVKSKCPTHKQSTPSIEAISSTFFKANLDSIWIIFINSLFDFFLTVC